MRAGELAVAVAADAGSDVVAVHVLGAGLKLLGAPEEQVDELKSRIASTEAQLEKVLEIHSQLLSAHVLVQYSVLLAVVALVGFSLLGAGTAVIFPLAISAAAQQRDRPAAVNVAALAQLSFVVFFLGPPMLGAVAEVFGIRMSFSVGLPFVVMSWFMVVQGVTQLKLV